MLAVLPRQQADDVAGELFVRAYQRQLGHYSNEAISFLANKATERCKWFPTIAECLDILKDWHRDDQASTNQSLARAAVRWEMQARMESAMTAMKLGEITQDEIDALLDQWKRIAAERCHLRLHGDGSFTLRRSIVPATDPTGQAA